MNFVRSEKPPGGLSKAEAGLLFLAHGVTALLVLSPFLPGPGFFSRETNALFNGIQLLSLPLFVLVPVGLFWQWRATAPRLYPLLVWTLPLMVAVHCFWTAPWARASSRSRAIECSTPLLRALAVYREQHGRYPEQLQALLPRYLPHLPDPGALGVAEYAYAPHEECFQLIFTQNVLLSFNYEVVVYDPHDHHQATGDLSTLYSAGTPHWRYYIYD